MTIGGFQNPGASYLDANTTPQSLTGKNSANFIEHGGDNKTLKSH